MPLAIAVIVEFGVGSAGPASGILPMSEYVEARYARLMLRDLQAATQDEAAKRLNDLLRDLGSPQRLSSAGAKALTSIGLLALSLDRPQSRDIQDGRPQTKLLKPGTKAPFTNNTAARLNRISAGSWRPVAAPKRSRTRLVENLTAELTNNWRPALSCFAAPLPSAVVSAAILFSAFLLAAPQMPV